MPNTDLSPTVPTVDSKKGFKISSLPALPIIIGLLFLILVGIGVWFLYPKNSISKELVEAQKATAKGDYKQSKEIYQKLIQKEKNNPIVQVGLINSISVQGNQNGQEKERFEEAKPYIDQALKDNPDDPEVLMAVGYAYETAGEYNKALEYYNKSLEINPKSSLALFHKGHVLQFLNKEAEAQKLYQQAYDINPSNPFVLIVRGNEDMMKKDFSEAYDTFMQALENSQGYPQLRSEALVSASIARRYQANSNPEYMKEALDLSKQAVDADPSFSSALGTYGVNLAISGNTDEGIKYLEKAIEANPRISRNYLELAEALRSKGDYQAAIANGQQAIQRVDNDNTLLGDLSKRNAKGLYTYDLAKSYLAVNSLGDLIPILQSSIQLNPNIKTLLKSDYERYGLFNQLEANPNFINLIN